MESIFGENDPTVNQRSGEKEPLPATLALLKNGANWFYWIAGLSVVNSAIYVFGSKVNFISGLAITRLIDLIADASVSGGSPRVMRGVAIGLDLILVTIFALLGYYAKKAINAVFIGGMVLYLIDGLLSLFFGSLFAVGLHVLILILIFKGFMASREINRIREHNALVTSSTINSSLA